VANPSEIRGGKKLRRKNDRIDADFLARQGRADPQLLGPIEHRGEKRQADLVLLATRGALVKCRSLLVSQVRGVVKSLAGRILSCSTDSFHRQTKEHLPPRGNYCRPSSVASLLARSSRADAAYCRHALGSTSPSERS
jgi:transposase